MMVDFNFYMIAFSLWLIYTKFSPHILGVIIIKKGTVLSRVIILFIAVIIPWSITSVYFLYTANHRITDTTLQMVQQSRTALVKEFEGEIVNTFSAAGYSDAMERAVYLSQLYEILTPFERSQAANRICESLTLIKTMGSCVSNARVYIGPLNTIYNSDGYSKGSVQSMNTTDYNSICSLSKSSLSFVVDNGRILLLLSNSEKTPTCIMEVELSANLLRHRLENSLEYEDASLFGLRIGTEDIELSNLAEEDFRNAAFSASEAMETSEIIRFSNGNEKGYLFSFHSKILDFTYFEWIPENAAFQPVQFASILTFLFAGLTILIILLFFVFAVRLIHKPLKNLTDSFKALRRGNFEVRASSPETADFVYLYEGFNDMASELQKLVTQNYQQKILLQKSELRQLQAQINPHFLYNSFFLLQRVIASEDTEQAEKIASALGTYFHYITKKMSDTVQMKDEVAHANIYTEIQSLRFANRIEVLAEKLPETCELLPVPKLFLQPLIENAFKYALESRLEGGVLRISYSLSEDGFLTVTVEDNGESLSDIQIEEIQQKLRAVDTEISMDGLSGLFNIARRIYIYSQGEGQVCMDRSPLGGARVSVILPVIGG